MLTTFWTSPQWYAYEQACVEEPGTRAKLLASATWSTRVLDLSASEDELWKGVRKSYHSLINKLDNDPSVMVCEQEPFHAMLTAFRLHVQCAGRETRPHETWKIQADWLQQGIGRCFTLECPDSTLGFLYAIVTPPTAYYFSAAALEPNVGHLLQWHAIKALKAAGVRYYELGWQGEATDDKGKAIEFAKRGYGGFDISLKDVYGSPAVVRK